MTMSSTESVWLTPAARNRLQDELTALSRAGAPSSPATERRNQELKDLLRRAEVARKPDDGLVEPGMVVSVRFDGDDEPNTFLLAQREIAAVDLEIDVYSPTSALGGAIVGTYPEESFSYTSPTGTVIGGIVLSASPFDGS